MARYKRYPHRRQKQVQFSPLYGEDSAAVICCLYRGHYRLINTDNHPTQEQGWLSSTGLGARAGLILRILFQIKSWVSIRIEGWWNK